jgi:hypothetical protein
MVLPFSLDGLCPFLTFIFVILFMVPLCFLIGELLKVNFNMSQVQLVHYHLVSVFISVDLVSSFEHISWSYYCVCFNRFTNLLLVLGLRLIFCWYEKGTNLVLKLI